MYLSSALVNAVRNMSAQPPSSPPLVATRLTCPIPGCRYQPCIGSELPELARHLRSSRHNSGDIVDHEDAITGMGLDVCQDCDTVTLRATRHRCRREEELERKHETTSSSQTFNGAAYGSGTRSPVTGDFNTPHSNGHSSPVATTNQTVNFHIHQATPAIPLRSVPEESVRAESIHAAAVTAISNALEEASISAPQEGQVNVQYMHEPVVDLTGDTMAVDKVPGETPRWQEGESFNDWHERYKQWQKEYIEYYDKTLNTFDVENDIYYDTEWLHQCGKERHWANYNRYIENWYRKPSGRLVGQPPPPDDDMVKGLIAAKDVLENLITLARKGRLSREHAQNAVRDLQAYMDSVQLNGLATRDSERLFQLGVAELRSVVEFHEHSREYTEAFQSAMGMVNKLNDTMKQTAEFMH